MKRTLAVAVAGALGFAGVAEAAPASAPPAPTRSIDDVRADAMARLAAGDVQTVDRRGHRNFRGGHSRWRGGHGWRGRGGHYGHRGWRGDRYYYRGHRRGHGHGGAVAAGIAGLAVGAIIADSAQSSSAPSKRWCASRYRSYDWRSSTYLGNDGRRRYCP